jgi:poly[(R)-3-hydroxyalkanoate] polymerase subunit PhaC
MAGVEAACQQITRLRDSRAFDGVHLVPVNGYREVSARLEALIWHAPYGSAPITVTSRAEVSYVPRGRVIPIFPVPDGVATVRSRTAGRTLHKTHCLACRLSALGEVMDNRQAPADVMDIMSEATEAAAGMLPFDMLGAVTDLVDPAAVAREMPWLAGELTKIALGKSDISFDPRDHRFTDEAWRTVPYFRILGQSYRLFELWMNRMYESTDRSWQNKARARFTADVITAALSPTNYLATHPAALRKAAATGGMSLVRGAQNMLKDMARGGMPSMVDRRQFVVGKDLACTPGAVVYRDEMFELLQYTPATPRVRAIPLLMIPPQINRHYVVDLSPGRSLAEFAVSQGIQVFMIVWRNPDSLLGHGSWGLNDYLAAEERANEVVKKVARTDKLNLLGLCAGGITLSYVLAHLAAIGDDSAGSATFVVTMLTGEKPNVVGMLDTSQARTVLEQAAANEMIVPGTALRSLFAMLRPNDLVFNYLVSGWLMGEPPARFDVLAWNDDATRATAKFALESTKLALDGWDGAGPTLLGVKTDFSKVTCDSYHVGGYTDHITAWRACYDTAHLVGGANKEMTLIKSGHIQSVVYPADSTRYDRWYAPPTPTDPDEWLKTATVEKGSWWRPWTEWLIARSGSERQARATLGNRQYPPIAPAPGTYVYE